MVERTQMLYSTFSTKRASPSKDQPEPGQSPRIMDNQLYQSGRSMAY